MPTCSCRRAMTLLLISCIAFALALQTGAVNRCGTSYSAAAAKCSKCPKGIDSECGAGETCYAGLPACGGNNGGVPGGPAGGTYATLNTAQKKNAHTIIQVGRDNNVPKYGQIVAIAAAMQESRLRNLNYGDRDSLGLFQQRPSSGWGTPAQITNPVLASKAFYGVASHTSNRGLLQVPNWQQLSVSRAAQSVQVSAFPDAYAKWEGLAREAVANFAS